LQRDLRKVGTQRPVVLVSHIPFFSFLPALINWPLEAVPPSLTITNSKEVLGFYSEYNVRLILQGHVHIVEGHQYKRLEYATSGAVCGNWWRGSRMGHPEGFAVYMIEGDQIRWHYHSFGWHAADAS
jgi:3',5'-cyclic-AMP phosphodiesterase